MTGRKVRVKKDEDGYALALVLILLILIGLIIGPLLLLMTTSLMSSQRHEEWMLGFYAADAGIEDAVYKVLHDDDNLPEEVGGSYGYPEYPALYLNDGEIHVTIEKVESEDPSHETYKVTSTVTRGSGSSTIESYVLVSKLDLSGLADNAISSLGDITIQPGTEIYGDVQYNGTLDNKGDIYGEVITDPIEYWPTAEQFSDYFLAQVDVLDPFLDDTIDLKYTDSIGPLYRDGNLYIYNKGSAGATATLEGTVYVTGDLEIGQEKADLTLDLNGQSIFVEGDIRIGPKTTFTGSGCIIAVGDIFFLPDISSGSGDFVFLMSVEGTVTLNPNSDFYGSVAGNANITIQPGNTLVWQDPGDLGFDLPSEGEAEARIRTYTIQ